MTNVQMRAQTRIVYPFFGESAKIQMTHMTRIMHRTLN